MSNWLQAASRASADRALHQILASSAEEKLIVLREAIAWQPASETKKPRLRIDIDAALKKEYPHARLCHVWCTIMAAKGISKAEAQGVFNDTLWPGGSGLVNEIAVKRHKQEPEEYRAFVSRMTQAWLRDAEQSLTNVASAPAPPSTIFLPGPAPVPASRELDVPRVNRIKHPGFADDLQLISDYFKDAPVPLHRTLDIAEKSETPEDVLRKATEYLVSPEGQAALNGFDSRLYKLPLAGPFQKAQEMLMKLQQARAQIQVWSTNKGSGRPPRQQTELEAQLAALRFRIKTFLEQSEALEQQFLTALQGEHEWAKAGAWKYQALRTHLAHMVGNFERVSVSLVTVLKKSLVQYKRQRVQADVAKCNAHMHVTVNPNTYDKSFSQCVDEIHLRHEQSTKQMQPLTAKQLFVIADFMRSNTGLTLHELFFQLKGDGKAQDVMPKEYTFAECVHQVLEVLPLTAVDFCPQYHADMGKDKHILLVNHNHRYGPALMYSLLASCQNGFKPFLGEDGDASFEGDASSDDGDETDDESDDGVRNRPGAKTVEEKYGAEFVEFMRTLVYNRGETALKDASRMNETLEVSTMPLAHLAAKATEAGFKLSRETVRRLFLPPQNNYVSSVQRGVISAKRASVAMSIAKWSERTCYSSNQVKMVKCFLWQTHALSIGNVWQAAVDEMQKTQIFIPNRPRGRGGYTLVDRKTGKAQIHNADKTFPIATGFLMTLSGVVECLREPEIGKVSASGKVLASTFRPSKTWAYIRSHRYHPGGSHTLQHDFRCAVKNSERYLNADICLVVSDNGGGYNLDSAFNHWAYGTLWRKDKKAMFIVAANAAGDSKYSWEVEQVSVFLFRRDNRG